MGRCHNAPMLEFRDTGTSRRQFAVMSGDVVIATVSKAGQAVVWHWSFKTTDGPPGFQQRSGAMNFDEAKAAVEAQWTRWLAAAGLGYIEGNMAKGAAAQSEMNVAPAQETSGSHRLQRGSGLQTCELT